MIQHSGLAATFHCDRRPRVVWTILAAALLTLLLAGRSVAADERKPTLFLIGDSTVKNHTAGQVGWGSSISSRFDRERIDVQNRALGGRSSRSFFREGLWANVLSVIKPGDFVIIQFGHNDNGPIADGKARASIKGNGDESQEVTVTSTNVKELVRSYGWYIRKYVTDAKAKGATAIVCSPVARNIWEDGKVARSTESFSRWARDAAEQSGAFFIDLNQLIAAKYEELGHAEVQSFFTPADHTHTNKAGAEFNAERVTEGLRDLSNCPLAGYLQKDKASAAKSLQEPRPVQ